MTDQMKCPKCGGEMEEGHLIMHGELWESKDKAKGLRGLFTKPIIKNTVKAFKCSKCGKIELYYEG